jgi:hypothetical protein
MSAIADRLPFRSPRGYADALIPEAREHHRRRRRRLLLLVAAAVACLAVLAYGVSQTLAGGRSTPIAMKRSAATVPSPCQLVTNDQVASVFASKVVNRVSDPVGVAPSCTWSGMPLATQFGQPSVMVSVYPITKAMFQRIDGETKTGERINGVGGEAFWFRMIDQLVAWQHGYEVSVIVHGPAVAAPLSADEALVRAALAHL